MSLPAGVASARKDVVVVKGLVFTTFYAHCEETYGFDMLEDIIEDADLPNKGAFTSVGTYPFQHMIALTGALVRRSGRPMPEMLEAFGRFCFGKWVSYVPDHFENKSLFDIMAGVDQFHQSEVLKLYPDAELPSFKVESRDERTLVLRYFSCKPLADLAAGVIQGAADHLGETIHITHWPVSDGTEAHVRFEVSRLG